MQLTYTITPTKYSYNVPLTYTIQAANTAPLLLYYVVAPQPTFAINGAVLDLAPDRVNYTLPPVASRTLAGMPILQGRRTVTFTYSVLQWPELEQLTNFY